MATSQDKKKAFSQGMREHNRSFIDSVEQFFTGKSDEEIAQENERAREELKKKMAEKYENLPTERR